MELPTHKAAENVRRLVGVKNVLNTIEVKPSTTISPEHVSNKILSAFQRHATLDARNLRVEVQGSKVFLRGFVSSWAEMEEARDAAWSVPGVTEVDSTQLYVKT